MLGRLDPDHVVGVHVNSDLGVRRRPRRRPGRAGRPDRRPSTGPAWRGCGSFQADGLGYLQLQSTRPQTLAYALTDSPVGQLAWIVEKFKEWTDPAADLPEDAVDRDQLLTNVRLYWLTGTGALGRPVPLRGRPRR